jgi:hypothetical protein
MRMKIVHDEEPAVTNARDRKMADIPPFTFVGDLTVGDSGLWHPPYPVLLFQAKLTSLGYGESSALLTFIKLELPRVESVLGSISLAADQVESLIYFKAESSVSPPIVTASEPLFIRSRFDSLHSNVVVQLTGEILE